MARNEVGKLRRSAVVSTFGPGAIVDFRADGAPVSGVAAGLDEWDSSFGPAGLKNDQVIYEERLQRKLRVNGFRLPPVRLDTLRSAESDDTRSLVAARFPEWLQCPGCDRLAQAGRWRQDPGSAARYCARCTHRAPGQRKVYVVPTRFVMACPKGHLDEFPWHAWVSHKRGCREKENAQLLLKAEAAGLAGLVLSCGECGARRSMDGIFGRGTWRDSTCRGRRPWLAADDEECTHDQRAVQRGASNIYFPVSASALTIPPWSDPLQQALSADWDGIVEAGPEGRSVIIRALARGTLAQALDELDVDIDKLVELIEERVATYQDDRIADIRQAEYDQFTSGSPGADRDFEARTVDVPEALQPYLDRIVRVVRLREVRALRSFTRIHPPGPEESTEYADLSVRSLDWLPAIEVRGEGIFLTLNPDALAVWEKNRTVIERAAKVDRAWNLECQERYEADSDREISGRFLLLHTFAHALIRQLTLESGYSSASLRERLYVSEGMDGMMGLMIYTATTDADGTLGGLQRQGEPERLQRTVLSGIRAMEWCSSDPLCIEGMVSADQGLSPAACHACVMAPETACEEFNLFLDRSFLVGLPGEKAVGFFTPLLAD